MSTSAVKPDVGIAYGVPAIDRAADLLERLEAEPGGLDLAALARRSGVSRSSAYRILNSLAARGFARRIGQGRFVLGGRLMALGAAAGEVLRERVLPDLLRHLLDDLAHRLDETARLSVLDRGTVLLVAGASPSSSHALGYLVGQTLPIHAGGGSKVLLAHAAPAERARLIARPLERYTDLTITEPVRLKAELAVILKQGLAQDPGEFSPRVQSWAAPVLDAQGVVAALSVAFAATSNADFHARIRSGVRDAANEASNLLAEKSSNRREQ